MDIIKTNRLVFREFTQENIDNLFLLLSDPIVMKYIREANYGDKKVHVYSINKSACHV